MPHLSKKRIDKKFDELLDTALDKVVASGSASLFTSILTKTEVQMLKKRLGIYMLLDAGHTLEQISQTTKTTLQTIIRYKTSLGGLDRSQKEALMALLRPAYSKSGTTPQQKTKSS